MVSGTVPGHLIFHHVACWPWAQAHVYPNHPWSDRPGTGLNCEIVLTENRSRVAATRAATASERVGGSLQSNSPNGRRPPHALICRQFARTIWGDRSITPRRPVWRHIHATC
jgi:hypothetical protein